MLREDGCRCPSIDIGNIERMNSCGRWDAENDPLFRSYRIMRQHTLTGLSILFGLLFAVAV